MNGSTPAIEPSEIEAQFERARKLDDLGRNDEARSAYLELIERAPGHFGTLNNLGNLLERTGFRRAARLAYAEAIKWHPANPIAYVNLGNSLLDADELDDARERYAAALRLDPSLPEAHQGMAYVFERLGDETSAGAHREAGFRSRALTRLHYRGEGPPIPAILLVSAAGGNIFTRDFLDERIFGVSRIFADYFPSDGELPEHVLVFNAIADADRCLPALDAARDLSRRTKAPTINAPDAVRRTARTEVTATLRGIAGVAAPATVPIARSELRRDGERAVARHGLSFPLLLRTPGHHTGRHFEFVPGADRLAEVAAALPGETLLAIEFLDARHADGKVRKFRVMMVDGKLYPLHLAISHEWKVHYFSAEMEHSPEHRAEEERFLDDPPAVLGTAAYGALREIARRLGLDYGGIDFGLNERGEVVLFEANAAMIVPPAGDDPRWAYRRPHVQRIFEAVRTMLLERAGRSPA